MTTTQFAKKMMMKASASRLLFLAASSASSSSSSSSRILRNTFATAAATAVKGKGGKAPAVEAKVDTKVKKVKKPIVRKVAPQTRESLTALLATAHPVLKLEAPVDSTPTLAENFQSTWPRLRPDNKTIVDIPNRTIPDEVLRFEMKASFENGTMVYYPHLQMNPVDIKVKLLVKMDDLGLTKDEEYVMVELLGPRYNYGRREIKLTTERFTNRLENRKYLTYLLERLKFEAKRLHALNIHTM